MFDQVGTEGYKSPEIIQIDSSLGYNYKVDVFSFASICYELYTRKYMSAIQCLRSFKHLKYNLHQTLIPKNSPKELSRLLSDCWQFDAEKRPNFADIMDRLMNKMIM
eukprot:UN11537